MVSQGPVSARAREIVIASRRDYEWAREIIRLHGLERRATVLLSVAFGRLEPSAVAEWMLEDGLEVRFQLQMHKFIWDPAARGV